MRVPLEWLSTYCDAGIGARDLGDRLTMTGTKLEAVHHHGVGALEAFVVGKVLEADRHPDADRLSVCKKSSKRKRRLGRDVILIATSPDYQTS